MPFERVGKALGTWLDEHFSGYPRYTLHLGLLSFALLTALQFPLVMI
jgi:hypothetical protein